MSLKRKGNFEYPKIARILSDKENINTDQENINPNKISSKKSSSGSDSSWGLGKLNLNAINKPFSYVNDNIDDGYETDDTVLDEDYVPPPDYKPPVSSYRAYLDMIEERKKKYDEGYETDDTVLDEDYEEYMKNKEKRGGRRTRRKRVRFSRKIFRKSKRRTNGKSKRRTRRKSRRVR